VRAAAALAAESGRVHIVPLSHPLTDTSLGQDVPPIAAARRGLDWPMSKSGLVVRRIVKERRHMPYGFETTNLLAADRELRGLASLPPELAVEEATSLLEEIAFDPHLLDLLPKRGSVAPTFRTLSEQREYSLQLFHWQPGSRTPIHDHSSWGVYVCLAGQLGEDRYQRLDDGSQPAQAMLRRGWRAEWARGERSILLPYEGGIHRVWNSQATPAVSLHLYGPRLGQMDGRDYDPRRDFVCDRPVEVTRN
jgi:predicted metal-dependent enzyme (double-stranded beta helix superfamily)